MILQGDEYGHTRGGNNNSYGHDNQMNHFLWSNHDQLPTVRAGINLVSIYLQRTFEGLLG